MSDTFKKRQRILYRVFKFFGYSFSAFFCMITMSEGFPPAEAIPVFLAALGIGSYSHYKGLQLKQTEDELRLVALIRGHEGLITLADIMLEFKCSGKEAVKKVSSLQSQGIIGTDVSSSGEVVYNLSSAYLGTI